MYDLAFGYLLLSNTGTYNIVIRTNLINILTHHPKSIHVFTLDGFLRDLSYVLKPFRVLNPPPPQFVRQ